MRVERADRDRLGLTVAVVVRGVPYSETTFAPECMMRGLVEGLYRVLVNASMFYAPHVCFKVSGSGVACAKADSVARVLANKDVLDVLHRRRARKLAKIALATKHDVPESQVSGGKAHKVDDSVDRELALIEETRRAKRWAEEAGEPWPQYLFAELGRYSRAMRKEEA